MTDSRFRTHPHMQRRWKQVGRTLAFDAADVPAWRTWRRALRRTLRELTGCDTMRPTPLRPKITEEVDCGDYLRQRIEIQTEPGVVMPLFVLTPQSTPGPWPAMMCPHGHGQSGGKWAVAGCRHLPGLAETIDQHNYDYGVQFARAGLIAFCPDARGFGERQEDASRDDPLAQSCRWINNMALPLGQTITGMWAWDLHRLIDYIATRTDCLPGRVGCAGLSGGGLQTLWASALDDRIRCAVVSGYFYGYKESLLDLHTNCSCNYVPHLYEVADMGDIGALIAPRPLLIETGTRDSLNGASGLKNVRSQVRITRRAYRLLGAGRNLKHVVFEGEHRWDGIRAIPFVKQRLLSDVRG